MRFRCIKRSFILFRLHGFIKVCITPKKFSGAKDSDEKGFETCGPNETWSFGEEAYEILKNICSYKKATSFI